MFILCGYYIALYYSIGTVPSTLCDITGLTLLHINAAGNPLMTCAPLCLTTVTTRSLPSAVCPSAQDDGLCGLIAATNIASITNYDEWSCTTDGVTSTDPCTGGSEWTGVVCTTGYVSEININNKGVTGIVNLLYLIFSVFSILSLCLCCVVHSILMICGW